MFSPDIRRAQRWCLAVTIVLVESVIWPNAMDGGIAKQPIFVLGATLIAALFIAEMVKAQTLALSFPVAGVLVALHLPLFLFSAWWTYDPVSTWKALGFGICCLIFFFAGSSLFPTKKEITPLLHGIEWLTLFLCIVGILQFAFGDRLPLNFYAGAGRRVSSLLGSSGTFAAYLVLVFPLLLAQRLEAGAGTARSIVRSLLLGTIIFLLIATQTRSSIVGLLASLGAFILLAPDLRRRRLILLIAALILAGMVIEAFVIRPELGGRFTMLGGGQSTLVRRIHFWEAGGNAFLAAPAGGHGIGSFERSVFAYRSPEYWIGGSEDVVPHAHNEIVEVAVEYGISGLLLLIATFALLVRQGIRAARPARGGWIGAGIVCSLVAVATDNLANFSLRQAPVAPLVWLFMGLLLSGGLGTPPGKKSTLPLRLPAYVAALPVLIWLLCAVVYLREQLSVIASDVHLLRGVITVGDPRAPLSDFEAAVFLDPLNPLARSQLTNAYLQAGRWDDALRSAGELQRLSPLYPKSFLMKADAQLGLGRYTGARESIERELKRRDHPEALMVQAALFRAMGDVPQERGAIIRLLTKDIEGMIAYGYRSACTRLVEISTTAQEREESIALFRSLQNMPLPDHDFFEAIIARSQAR